MESPRTSNRLARKKSGDVAWKTLIPGNKRSNVEKSPLETKQPKKPRKPQATSMPSSPEAVASDHNYLQGAPDPHLRKSAKWQYYSGGIKGRSRHLRQLWETNKERNIAKANEKKEECHSEIEVTGNFTVEKRPRGRPKKTASNPNDVVPGGSVTDAPESESAEARQTETNVTPRKSSRKSKPVKMHEVESDLPTGPTKLIQQAQKNSSQPALKMTRSVPQKASNACDHVVKKATMEGFGKPPGVGDSVKEAQASDLTEELPSTSAMRISQATSDVLCKLHGKDVWKDVAQEYDLVVIQDMERKQVVLFGTMKSVMEACKEIGKMCASIPCGEPQSLLSESGEEAADKFQVSIESHGLIGDKNLSTVSGMNYDEKFTYDAPVTGEHCEDGTAHDASYNDSLIHTPADGDCESALCALSSAPTLEAESTPQVKSEDHSEPISVSQREESTYQVPDTKERNVEAVESSPLKSDLVVTQPRESVTSDTQAAILQSSVTETQPCDPEEVCIVESSSVGDSEVLDNGGGDPKSAPPQTHTEQSGEPGAMDIMELLGQVEGDQLQEVGDIHAEQEVLMESEDLLQEEGLRNRLLDGTRIHGKAYAIKNPSLATHRCGICGFTSSLKGIYKHRIRKHSSVLYQCEVCSKTFGLRYDMRRHRIKHFDDDGNLTLDGLSRLLAIHPDKEPFKLQTLELGFLGEQKEGLNDDESRQAVSELVTKVLPLEENVDDGTKESPCQAQWNKVELRPTTSLMTHNPSLATEQCDLCDFKSTSGGLVKHKQRHHARMTFVCPVCPKRFAIIHDMQRHLVCHTVQHLYSSAELRQNAHCELCGFRGTEDLVIQHQKSTHASDFHKCMYCPATFQTLRQMKEHVQLRHPDVLKTVPKASTLKRLPSDDQRLKCSVCNKEILASRFQQHTATHERQGFQCELCDYTAKWAWMVRRHHRVQHLNHRYICDFCGKSFVQDSALSTHIKTQHQDHGTFSCPECPSSFGAERYLKTHIQRMHRDKKKHFCDICGRKFFEKIRMKEHRQTHDSLEQREENKKFECSFCGRKFQKKTYLEQHENSHRGLKPYMCSVCGKCFSWISELHKHKHLHNPTKAFKCSVCNRGFHFRHQLGKHMITHTKSSAHVCLGCGKAFTLQTTLRRHRCRAILQCQLLSVNQSQDITGNPQLPASAANMLLDNNVRDDGEAKVVYMCGACRTVFSNVDEVNSHIAEKHGTQSFVMHEGEAIQGQNDQSQLTTVDVNQIVSTESIEEVGADHSLGLGVEDTSCLQSVIHSNKTVGTPMVNQDYNGQGGVSEVNGVSRTGEQIQLEVVNIDVISDSNPTLPVDDVHIHEEGIEIGVPGDLNPPDIEESSNKMAVVSTSNAQQIVYSIDGQLVENDSSNNDHQSKHVDPSEEGKYEFVVHVVDNELINVGNIESENPEDNYIDSSDDLHGGIEPQYVIIDSDEQFVSADMCASSDPGPGGCDVPQELFTEGEEDATMLVVNDLDPVEMVIDGVVDVTDPQS